MWPAVISPGGVHVARRCRLTTLDPATGATVWAADTVDGAGSVCAIGSGTSYGDSLVPFVVGDVVHIGTGTVTYGRDGTPTSCDGTTAGFRVGTGERVAVETTGALLAVRGDRGVGVDCRVVGPGRQRIDVTAGALGAPGEALGFPEYLGPTDVTLGDDTLYVVGGDGGGIRAFPLTGFAGCGPAGDERCPTWAVPDDGGAGGAGSAGPAVIGDHGATLYVASRGTGRVQALVAATGGVRWTSPPVGASASPALADGTLYVGTATGGVAALDAATGAVRWQATNGPGAPVGVQPVVAGGLVFTGSGDGTVRAHDAAGCPTGSCPPLWSTSTGTTAVTGGLAVSDGRLYVPVADGRLVAYHLP